MRRHVVEFASLPCCLYMLAASTSTAASGDIFNLGTLGGDSYGIAINASGQVTGYSYATNGIEQSFRYTGTPGSGGAMSNLGTLGGLLSRGYAINPAGQVAGYSQTASSGIRPFLYSDTPGGVGAMADLGSFGGSYGEARGINASEQVAGTSYTTGSLTIRAFLYGGTPGAGGSMVDIGTLGGLDAVAQGINDSGQIVGFSEFEVGNPVSHAFLYTGTPGSGGTIADLGTLAGTSAGSVADAINASGQVVGFSAAPTVGTHAFIYSGTPGSGGAMTDLGTLGGTKSYAYGINNAGQVAGSSYLMADNTQHAFLYVGTPGVDGHMIDLDAWLDANNPTEGAKWTLRYAYGLTDTGLLTGEGAYNDGPGGLSDGGRAFVLDASALVVPEPATFVLLGLGGFGLLWWRGKKAGSQPVIRLVTWALVFGAWRLGQASITFNDGAIHDITTPVAGTIFAANSPTTVNILPGGRVAGPNVTGLSGPEAGVSIRGGTVNISGGSVVGGSVFNGGLPGGTEAIEFPVVGSGGVLNITGGSVTAGNAFSITELTKAIEVNNVAAVVNISGGTISNGTTGSELLDVGRGVVNITGGSFIAHPGTSSAFFAGTGAVINIAGSSFNYPFGPLPRFGTLSGTLLDGSPINVSFDRFPDGSIVLVPEPASSVLLAIGATGLLIWRSMSLRQPLDAFDIPLTKTRCALTLHPLKRALSSGCTQGKEASMA